MKYFFVGCFTLLFTIVSAQNNTGYWQQNVAYKMDIDFNVETHQYKGVQELMYTNNSPDTIHRVFYHLYFNAFQPGSDMDMRSLHIADPDRRVGDRISKLAPEEIGYIKPTQLRQDGKDVKYKVVGTILEVALDTPLLPNKSTLLKMNWDAQVPIQIRRSGRDNAEGVAYSMAQWYPKLAEYDFEGWHVSPYIGREFHGVWGDFEVTIKIDKDYIVGGSGYLQNGDKKGLGKKSKKNKRTWHFIAPKVHDFTWAADDEYIHDSIKGPNEVTLNFYYKNNPKIIENWKKLQPKTAELLAYFNEHIGEYPYHQYSVIQGGDGGMEYAMCTLITGERKFGSLVGVTSHELAHSWFQFLLATNELKHGWMDEGFTSYISNWAMNSVMDEKKENPTMSSYKNYKYIASSGKEQPQTTQADRFTTNQGYGISAYSKGAVFLAQLGYVIGKENLDKTIKRYYNEWKFRHPTPNDFIRIAEKVSGIELDWYLKDWTETTNTIDYGIKEVRLDGAITTVSLERIGLMPMPVDVNIVYTDGSKSTYYVPLQMMHGHKPNPNPNEDWLVMESWAWANPNYTLTISNKKKIKSITLDASQLMADINLDNNSYTFE